MISRPFCIALSDCGRPPPTSRQTLRRLQYSVAALRNAADFLLFISFRPALRRDTNEARHNLGETIMTETLNAWAPRALSVLRIITGLMIIEHGMAKLIGYPVVAAFANLKLFSLLGAAGAIELIGGALLILGLFTQPAAFILSGEMAVAYFMVHAPRGFYPLINGGTLAIIYCFACLYLSTAGAGPWSVDAQMKRT
jgi:putative oxidoreductase